MDDGALIAASIADPERFGELFDRHARAVLRYATARLGASAAEDVVAETFLAAFERRDRFQPDRTEALPWLLGIATNLVRHRWRDEARALQAMQRLVPESTDDAPGRADDRVDAQRELHRLASRLRRLAPADRDTLLLFAWAGLGYEAIAEATGVPVGTVRSRLHRARRIVRGTGDREVLGGSAGFAAAGS